MRKDGRNRRLSEVCRFLPFLRHMESPAAGGDPDVEVSEFMEHAVLFCIDIDTRRFTALVVLAEEDVPFKRQTHEIGAVAYEILRIKLHRGFGHSALRFLPPLPEGASYVNAER